MLFTGLCHAFFWVCNTIVSAFPVADTSWLAPLSSKIANVLAVLHELDAHLPVVAWIAATSIFAGVWVSIGLVVMIRKLWSLVSGGGGI